MTKKTVIKTRRTAGEAPEHEPPDSPERSLGKKIMALFAKEDRWRGVSDVLREAHTLRAGATKVSVKKALQDLVSRGDLQFHPGSRKYRLSSFVPRSQRKAASEDSTDHSIWPSDPGATLSHHTAVKEYGLTDDEIQTAANQGELHFVKNYCHGSPYYRLVRKEVEALVRRLRSQAGLKRSKLEAELAKIKSELNSLKRKMALLERRQAELVKLLDKE